MNAHLHHPASGSLATLRSAALISFLLVLPFIILELLNQPMTWQSFPGLIFLFGVLWLLPVAFILILMPMVRAMRAGNNIMAAPAALLLRGASLILIAAFWGILLMDQLPCFLGVPNCD